MLALHFVARDLRHLDEVSAEIVTCGVYRDERPLAGLAGLLDWRLAGRLSRLAKDGFLLGEVGELLAMPVRPQLPFDKLIVAGLGPRTGFGDGTFREVLARTMLALEGLNAKNAIVELPGRGDEAISPERAADLLLDVLGDDDRDELTFVEDPNDQQRIEREIHERRRTAPRTERPGAR